MRKQNNGYEEKLRAQFTSWLTTLLRRARIDYVRQQERQVKTVSMEDVPDDQLAVEDSYSVRQSQFDFEEERLAEAFFSLSLQRQQVLTMLFVDEMRPEEVAKVLHCSVGYIHKARQRALQSLRKMLNGMEDTP